MKTITINGKVLNVRWYNQSVGVSPTMEIAFSDLTPADIPEIYGLFSGLKECTIEIGTESPHPLELTFKGYSTVLGIDYNESGKYLMIRLGYTED